MTAILLSFDEGQVAETHLARMAELVPEAQVVVTREPDKIEAIAEDVEIVMGWIPPELLFSLPNLRWYQQAGVGIDWLLRYPEGVARDFSLTNASGVHHTAINELIFAYLLAFARNLPMAARTQSQRTWQPVERQSLFQLTGKTMLVIGLGAIGSRTARIASALGMRVLGVRRNPAVEAWDVAQVFGRDQLLEVLPEADVVVLTLPLTKETRHFITRRELARMKPSAYLINIGRGPVVKEADLIEALQSGAIAGAGLDVFEVEPLPDDSPLWGMENVIITAHYASSHPEYYERVMALFLDNLRRYQDGEALRNLVDKKRGY